MAARNPFVKLKFYLTFIKHLFRGPNSFPCGPECVIIIIAAQRGPPGSILWHFCHSDTFATLWRSCNTVTLIPQWHLCNTNNKKWSEVAKLARKLQGKPHATSAHLGFHGVKCLCGPVWSGVAWKLQEKISVIYTPDHLGNHYFIQWNPGLTNLWGSKWPIEAHRTTPDLDYIDHVRCRSTDILEGAFYVSLCEIRGCLVRSIHLSMSSRASGETH